MRVPNLHTAPMRHLIKIRTFLKKIDSYLEKHKFARLWKAIAVFSDQMWFYSVVLALYAVLSTLYAVL